MIVEPKQA